MIIASVKKIYTDALYYLSLSYLKQKWWQCWWNNVESVGVNVKWPSGTIVVDSSDSRWYDCGATLVEVHSSDPNDFYGPWLRENVGRQSWDWWWTLETFSENMITLKVRKRYAKQATTVALMWS